MKLVCMPVSVTACILEYILDNSYGFLFVRERGGLTHERDGIGAAAGDLQE